MWRRSSPGTYSRRAWKARSLIEVFWAVDPSRSRTRPTPKGSRWVVRGWTNTSVRSVHSCTRRKRPSGSPRTVRTGPTSITPRRWVGTTKSSVCSAPGSSIGRSYVTPPAPIGNSRLVETSGPRASLRARSSPVSAWPTATRGGSTTVATASRVRPIMKKAAPITRNSAAIATTAASIQPSAVAATQASAPRSSTPQPIEVTVPNHGRTRSATKE